MNTLVTTEHLNKTVVNTLVKNVLNTLVTTVMNTFVKLQ